MQIEPGVPVRDVVEVVLDAFTQGCVAAPAVDLRPAGDAGLDTVAGRVVGNGLAEAVNEHRPLRPRADQAHVAFEHIDKLRQFVQARCPNERSEPGAARIVFLRPDRAGLLLGIDAHAAEFQHLKHAAVQAAPFLTVEHRAGAGELDKSGDQQQERRNDDQTEERQHDVHRSFDHNVEAEVRAFAETDYRQSVQVGRRQRQPRQARHIGDQAHFNEGARQDVIHVPGIVIPAQGQ